MATSMSDQIKTDKTPEDLVVAVKVLNVSQEHHSQNPKACPRGFVPSGGTLIVNSGQVVKLCRTDLNKVNVTTFRRDHRSRHRRKRSVPSDDKKVPVRNLCSKLVTFTLESDDPASMAVRHLPFDGRRCLSHLRVSYGFQAVLSVDIYKSDGRGKFYFSQTDICKEYILPSYCTNHHNM